MKCRFCKSTLTNIFLDLGMSPMANSFLKPTELNTIEPSYPLCAYVCSKCFLVQLDEFEKPEEIFSNYAYFSSFSTTWNDHIEEFVNRLINKFKIDKQKHVIEIASNDGYLLQHFKKNGIPILGIEPAKNIASYAESKGIPTINKFFGVDTAQELVQNGQKADFLIAFNVMPHVPNLNDFVNGLKMILNNDGILIIQFSAYLLKLIELNEFDMIYHEHFSYFSLGTLKKILAELKLKIFDVEELSIHGGSLRLYIIHEKNNSYQKSMRVDQLLEKEKQFGLLETSTYDNFAKNIQNVKQDICNFFAEARKENKKIVCYGAPAKGNTLLNFCGIGNDFIEYTVDKNPHKQELFLPGTHIPIYSPEKVLSTKPDYLLILPWNLKDEIIEQMSFIRDWNGKFVVLMPKIEIIN